jgi:hypothetical protein
VDGQPSDNTHEEQIAEHGPKNQAQIVWLRKRSRTLGIAFIAVNLFESAILT